jgi:hypothetical protein
MISRPVDLETRAVYARRWAELPERSRTPGQTIGRHAVGCEGTHGVFPRCNFSCQPCYHSAEANRVRIDGPHTVARIREQMALLRRLRGPHGHAQLIGGEVSLLDPDDHAEALTVMRSFGRNPMSMTHGDFDYDYLRRVCVDRDGRPRFRHVSFAGHFDTTMIGRSGARRPRTESELHGHRQAFCDMFARLHDEYGIRSYLAHNMTVTPANVEKIPEVIEACRHMGFKMWALIEQGAGTRLPWEVLQVGDARCNRTSWGFYVGERWHSLLDDTDPRDLAARDRFFEHLGGVHFNAPPKLLAARLVRVTVAHPSTLVTGLGWLARTVRRVGPIELARRRPEPMTFVMHRFMHADDVAVAWELMEKGEQSDEPGVIETQERLAACSYVMAHRESGRLVPACVQHSVLDPGENRQLAQLLPLPTVRSARARTGQ